MIIIFKIQGRYLIFWKILSSVLFIFVSFDSNSFQHPTVCRRTKQIIHNFTCEQAGAISHTTSRPNPAHQTILSAELLALPALLPCTARGGGLDSWQSITDSGSGAWTNDVNVVLLNNPRVVREEITAILPHPPVLSALSVLPPWERILSRKNWSNCSNELFRKSLIISLHQIILLLPCLKCLPWLLWLSRTMTGKNWELRTHPNDNPLGQGWQGEVPCLELRLTSDTSPLSPLSPPHLGRRKTGCASRQSQQAREPRPSSSQPLPPRLKIKHLNCQSIKIKKRLESFLGSREGQNNCPNWSRRTHLSLLVPCLV